MPVQGALQRARWHSAAGGHWHTVGVLESGELFAWGYGGEGQLGHGGRGEAHAPHLLPRAVFGGSLIVQAACGNTHTAAITEEGSLWTWGDGGYGKLGHGDEGDCLEPTLLLSQNLGSERVVSVACGSWHTACITEGGKLWTWGFGAFGKLGHGDESNRSAPALVQQEQFLDGGRVMMVSCGGAHTAAVVDSGAGGGLWSWGSSDHGQLGHGDTEKKLVPTLVSVQNVAVVSCGQAHTACVADGGSLYTWGWGEQGQLGHNDKLDRNSPGLIAPQKLGGQRMLMVDCGYAHTAAVSTNGDLWTWGINDDAQLGQDDTHSRMVPTPIQAQFGGGRVIDASCGDFHTVAIVEGGGLWTWGR